MQGNESYASKITTMGFFLEKKSLEDIDKFWIDIEQYDTLFGD